MTTIPNITDCELISGTPESATEPHDARTLIHPTAGLMSEIEDGIFVAWDTCRRCRKNVSAGSCKCPEGPQEPEYITRWRQARFATSLTDRLAPRLPTPKGLDLDIRQEPAPSPSPSVEQGLDAAIEAVKATPRRLTNLSHLMDTGAIRATSVSFLDLDLYINDDPSNYNRTAFLEELADLINEAVGEGIAVTVHGSVFATPENVDRAKSLAWESILQGINLADLVSRHRVTQDATTEGGAR